MTSSSSTTATFPRSPLQKLPTFKDPTTTTTDNNNPLTTFSKDPILHHFLSPTFSSTTFSSAALSSGSSASTLEHLRHSLSLLDSHLRTLVLSHHPTLLSQLSSLHSTASSLSTLRSSLTSLHSSVLSTRSHLSHPLSSISSLSTSLEHLLSTSLLLSSLVKTLRLISKLKLDSNSPSPDLLKSAQLHFEVASLVRDNHLAGIDVIDAEITWVDGARARLRKDGMAVLENGLDGLNQAEVGTGLQLFYNLGELKTTVDGLVDKYKGVVVSAAVTAFDSKAISGVGGGGGGGGGFRGPGGVQRSGMPPIGSGERGKDVVWQRLSSCMDQVHSVMVCVWVLQRVLSKKRDPFTHLLLLDDVIQEGEPMLTERVWEAFVNSFASQMKSATTSSFVSGIFTVGYPKLYSMIENLLERVSRETDVKGVLPAISPEGKEQMRAAIEVFRTSFLAQCLKNLSDRVNSVFSRGGFLSKDDISSIIMRMQEEIEAVQFDGHLTLMVLREIGKVLFLLAEKAEYQISTGPEARQITGPATPAQLKNFMICQHLQEIHTRISALLLGLPREASELLSPSLGAIYGIACDSVETLFQAMLDRLQSCILQIHDQNFGVIGMDSATDNNASPYMEELQKCILHFRSQFLSRLLPSSKTAGAAGTESISTKLARGMASRVLMFFIRHAALVRPLSESGKLRMARDMAELELAVGQNLFPVEQLGAPYRALRAFRPVIFLETSQLEESPLLQDLRPSTILHHLYSRGPDELQSPMQRNKLTPLQYSLWLDSQGEDQIWKGIKATLDDYAAFVKSRGDKEFDPVYPIMLQIGSSLAENSSQSKNTGYSD